MTIWFLTRRAAQGAIVVAVVTWLTFTLFFVMHGPDAIARTQLGPMASNEAAVVAWKHARGYDLPVYWNGAEPGIRALERTLFHARCLRPLTFQFGKTEAGVGIGQALGAAAVPTFELMAPVLLLGLVSQLGFALLLVRVRGTLFDRLGTFAAACGSAISIVIVAVTLQRIVSIDLRAAPLAGWLPGILGARFLVLPVLVATASALGPGVLLYRAALVRADDSDAALAARLAGLPEHTVLLRHVLPQALPVVAAHFIGTLPGLAAGNAVLESHFGIPGLGALLVESLRMQDLPLLQALVVLGSLAVIVSLLLLDLVYLWIDPRVRLR